MQDPLELVSSDGVIPPPRSSNPIPPQIHESQEELWTKHARTQLHRLRGWGLISSITSPPLNGKAPRESAVTQFSHAATPRPKATSSSSPAAGKVPTPEELELPCPPPCSSELRASPPLIPTASGVPAPDGLEPPSFPEPRAPPLLILVAGGVPAPDGSLSHPGSITSSSALPSSQPAYPISGLAYLTSAETIIPINTLPHCCDSKRTNVNVHAFSRNYNMEVCADRDKKNVYKKLEIITTRANAGRLFQASKLEVHSVFGDTSGFSRVFDIRTEPTTPFHWSSTFRLKDLSPDLNVLSSFLIVTAGRITAVQLVLYRSNIQRRAFWGFAAVIILAIGRLTLACT